MPSAQALSSRPVAPAKQPRASIIFLLSGWTDSGLPKRRSPSDELQPRATEQEPSPTKPARYARVESRRDVFPASERVSQDRSLARSRCRQPGADADGRNIACAKQKQQHHHHHHAPTHPIHLLTGGRHRHRRVRKPKPVKSRYGPYGWPHRLIQPTAQSSLIQDQNMEHVYYVLSACL